MAPTKDSGYSFLSDSDVRASSPYLFIPKFDANHSIIMAEGTKLPQHCVRSDLNEHETAMEEPHLSPSKLSEIDWSDALVQEAIEKLKVIQTSKPW